MCKFENAHMSKCADVQMPIGVQILTYLLVDIN